MTATIFEAKTTLSDLIRRVQSGEEVLITSGRERKPVVRLSPVEELQTMRLGVCYNQNFELGNAFWEPLPPGWSGDDTGDGTL